MFVLFQKVEEEGTCRDENQLMGFHLAAIFTGQGDISELLVLSQLPKGGTDVLPEAVP